MKTCTVCKQDKNIEDFSILKGKPRAYCKKCNNERHKIHYQNNKQKYIDDAIARKRKVLQWFRDYKKTLSCTRCPENHPATLDFHHPHDNKEHNISQLAWECTSTKRLLKEINKCIILCSNCHRKEHYRA